MKSKAIKSKILISLVVFSIFIIFLLLESQLLISSFLYERYQIKDMEMIANDISNISDDRLGKFLAGIVYKNDVCIEFVSNDGTSILFNDDSTGCLLGKNKKELAKYQKQFLNSKKNISAIKLTNPDYEEEALLYGIRVDEGYVYVFTMLGVVNKNSLLVDGQMFYISLIILFVAVIISYFLSYKLSEPIVNITEKSKLVAKGNYNVVFEKNCVKEIDELVDTLNHLENEVKKTDQYRRDLMANVSHDLKTPLTMIRAYAEMVRDISYKDKEKMDANLNVIIEETDRLNLLVSDILSLSKLEANADKFNYEQFNISDEIKSIINRYSILTETEGYNIEFEGIDDAYVKADKNKINQVIYNLINNAINYTGDNKKVIVSIEEEKKNYVVKVTDFGKGIKEDEIEGIWDRYYKIDKKHKRNVIGTGLGLSIVKNILESHKCQYGVCSKLNEGSVFYFKIKKVVNKK